MIISILDLLLISNWSSYSQMDLKSFSKMPNKNAYVSIFIFRSHDIGESVIFNGDSNFAEYTINMCYTVTSRYGNRI